MRTWAIIVGINEYPEVASQKVLKGAVADALDFADWALHPHGGNVEASRLFLWTHPAPTPGAATPAVAAYLAAPTAWWGQADPLVRPDRPPSMMEIVQTAYRAAQDALALGNEDGEESRCYILFAGHGVQARVIGAELALQTCFLAGDFQSDGIITGLLPSDNLREGLLVHGFSEVFLFLDCCRLDLSTYNTLVAPLPFPAGRSSGKSRWSICRAAEPDSVAWETPLSDPTRGAFTQLLVEGLRQARNLGNNKLTLQQLNDYVGIRIAAAVAPEKQSPHTQGSHSLENLIVVQTPRIPVSERAMAAIVVNCRRVPSGTLLRLLDQNDVEVISFESNGADVTQYARPGKLYSVASVDGAFETEFMHGGQGDTHVEL